MGMWKSRAGGRRNSSSLLGGARSDRHSISKTGSRMVQREKSHRFSGHIAVGCKNVSGMDELIEASEILEDTEATELTCR